MTVFTEGAYLSDGLLWEMGSEVRYARDQVTVISGQNLAMFTVVGKITASGKHTILAPAASDGSQTPVGIMLQDCDASAADRTDGLLMARTAIFKDSAVIWPSGITAGQKTAAIATLKTLGILIRDGA
jgi:hypothetical protein